jgi:stearoyl-CoA desaturase (delta-9 desaturase)
MSATNSVQSLPRNEAAQRLSLGVRLATLVVITLPVLGLVAAALLLWGWGFSWVDLGLLLGMYFVTAVGITVGFHRLFVHRAFETNSTVKFILAALGSMAVQAPLFKWVAVHRRHHRHSDEPGDPHSPHHHGPGLLGWLRGYWHSHIGWFFDPDPPDLDHYIKDLRQDPVLRLADSLFLLWVALGLVIPAVLGGILKGWWAGVWTGLLWGGLVRIFLVHHVTWSVNSACHLWGFRPYRSDDESRNNFLFGVLALGEGFHNTHHAFPTSARHGLRWWEFDLSYWVIRLLALLGLARNVKLPTPESQERARRGRRGQPAEVAPDAPSADVPAPPLAPLLMLAFWVLVGAAAGINLMQAVWRMFGWEVGEVSIAVPVGGGIGALLGALLGLVRDPRVLVLLLAVYAAASAGSVAGRLPWGAVGEVAGAAIGGGVGAVAWATWLFAGRGTAAPTAGPAAVGDEPQDGPTTP